MSGPIQGLDRGTPKERLMARMVQALFVLTLLALSLYYY